LDSGRNPENSNPYGFELIDPQAGVNNYSRVPAHRNWQIETAAWNLAGFFHCASKTCWQRFGQFLNVFFNDLVNDFLYETLDFLYANLDFLCENFNFLYENLRFFI